MKRECRNCRHWEPDSKKVASSGRLTVGTCCYFATAKQPQWLEVSSARTLSDEGTSCEAYEAETEK